MIAANNVMNAIFMIGSALAGAVLLKVMSAQGFFLLLGLANAVASIFVARLLTQELAASIAGCCSACSTGSRSRAWRTSAPPGARR